MKRIFYLSVIAACVASHYFVAREEMRRDENRLKVPPFTAIEYEPEVPSYINPVVSAPIEQVKSALLPLLDSESVEKAAELLKGVSEPRAREIVDAIFSDETFRISQMNRRLFVAAVASHYTDNSEERAAFFEVLLKYPDLYEGEPFIYTLITNDGYEVVIPSVLNAVTLWEKEKKFSLPEELKSLVLQAYSWIIQRNDTRAIRHLLDGRVPIDADTASNFLWQAASLPKSCEGFVELFANKGANLSYTKDGYTVLMKAVENDNFPFVKALVKRGAPVNAIIDSAIGTAVQIANEKGLVAIEMFLFEHGAKL